MQMQLEVDIVTSKRSKTLHAARNVAWEGWVVRYVTLCGLEGDTLYKVNNHGWPAGREGCKSCKGHLAAFLP